MAAAPQETPAENIRKRVEALTNTPTEAELAALKEECQRLEASEQENLRQQLETVRATVEATREAEADKKLIQLEVITALLEQLAFSAAPDEAQPPPPAAPTQTPEAAQNRAGNSNIMSRGQELGTAAGAVVGNVAGGGVEGGWNLLRREKAILTDPTIHTSDKILRYTGIAAAGVGLFYLLRRIVRGPKDAETGKRKGGVMRGILTALGITALAGWGLNAVRPWAEKQIAKEEDWRKHAEATIARGGSTTETPAGAPSSAPAQAEAAETVPSPADIAKQLPEGTDLKAAEQEIILNGEKMKFQVTDTGIILNGTTYKVNTETPAHWVKVLDTNLQPQITKATWQRGGIELDAKVNYKERAGFFDGTPVDGMTEYKNVLIPFEKVPAFFAQAKTGRPFKYSHEIALGGWVQKDFSFETTGTTS
ncbi:MAG: hypothetical protein PHO92_01485 [Candidatus Peribacteraceae bacterium]|nr:hypothetical protein [Candidatus Peribacteraceae bacterium]